MKRSRTSRPLSRKPPSIWRARGGRCFTAISGGVAGHRFLRPCRDERAAEKLCRRLREEWDENSLSAASRASG